MIYLFLIIKNYITVISLFVVLIYCETKNETPKKEQFNTSVRSLNSATMDLQTIPTIAGVYDFFNNQNLLITYREGEVVFGTYYFIEVHYCTSGEYRLYGKSIKQTVLGNEQRTSWQEFGIWKIIKRDKTVGIYYTTTTGVENFVPIYRKDNGDLMVNPEITIVNQGLAICN